MSFVKEFHERGKLSKHTGATFVVLVAKKVGANYIKD